MSIPPLMCSTPPPLEQVECEDVVHDDFAISYSLSQEDEDFGAYDDFHSAVPTIPYHSPTVSEHEVTPTLEQSTDSRYDHCPHKFSTSQKITNVDEDNNIEDLDLSFETNKTNLCEREDIQLNDLPDSEESISKCNSLETNEHHFVKIFQDNIEVACTKKLKKDLNTELDVSNVEQEPLSDNGASIDEFAGKEEESENSKDISFKSDDNSNDFVMNNTNLEKEELGDLAFHHPTNGLLFDEIGEQEELANLDNVPDCADNTNFPNIKTFKSTCNVVNDDDDFNSFDTSLNDNTETSPYQTMLAEESNPWSSSAAISDDFGNFQATFDIASHQENLEKSCQNLTDDTSIPADRNGSFDDFDDFQSSQNAVHAETEINNKIKTVHRRESDFSIPLTNTHSESQLMESIEKSVHSLFEDELPGGESSGVENNLEASLCVTWGHLTETEIRQPYMLNWNNSFGQKALLKSLCIDSRNILFGPKWGNMPRYAATLASAPLQPVKQPMGTQHTDATDADKCKRADSWSDAAAGNESCNDSSVQSPGVASKSYQDDFLQPVKHFAPPPPQPIRHINLPDTHIYTPTDSEVPRSTTIHYDLSTLGSTELPARSGNISPSRNAVHAEDDDFGDFKDFQDVRNTSQTSSKPVQSVIENTSQPAFGVNETLILEPIKLEPDVPRLNWPEPGEVKETFDDFSDFVSESSWSNFSRSNEVATAVADASQSVTNDMERDASNDKSSTEYKEVRNAIAAAEIEDDFDTFQAAPMKPVQNKWDPISSLDPFGNFSPKHQPLLQNKQPHPFLQELPSVLPANAILSPPAFPSPTILPQTTAFPQNSFLPPTTVPNSNMLPPPTFQPIHVDKTCSPERKEQILQPLSLESISQISWPSPGIDLQDLSRFNPINAVRSLHNSPSKSSPDRQEDGWGDFVSIKPTTSVPASKSMLSSRSAPRVEDDDWSDFVSSSSENPHNGVNTISFNVHTKPSGRRESPFSIPSLGYITPKVNHKGSKDSRFQNL